MKKLISIFVLTCFLFLTIFNIPKVIKPLYAWTEIIQVGIFIVVDTTAKWVEKRVNSKGGSKIVREPKSGYGNDDKYWKFEDLEGHFEKYREEYTFMTDNAPNEAILCISNKFESKVMAQTKSSKFAS